MLCVVSTKQAQRLQTTLPLSGMQRRGQMAQCAGRRTNEGAPKTPNVTSTFFITVHVFPKDLTFERGNTKLVSCLRRHLTSVQPWRLCDRIATITPRKRNGSYDSGSKYMKIWVIPFVWVQKAVYGSVCKLWHDCIQSAQSHKPMFSNCASRRPGASF